MQLPIVVLLIIFTAQAAKAFAEENFKLVATGWFANLVYLLFGHASRYPNDEIFRILARSLPAPEIARTFNVIALLLFLVAAQHFFRLHRPELLLARCHGGILVISGVMLLGLELLRSRGGFLLSTTLHTPAVLMAIGAVFSIAFMFDDTLRSRESERRSKSRILLVGGTLAYALVQPLAVVPGDWTEVAGFTAGFLCKMAMVIGLVGGFVMSAEAAARTGEIQRRFGQVARTIGRITHELGTPIRLLDNQVTALLRVAPSRGDFARHLEGLENTVLRIDAVIDATLTLLPKPDTLLDVGLLASDPAGALPERSFQNTNINTLVQLALMAVKETRGERVYLRTSYSGHCCVNCVPFEIVQILINVLRNAYDAIPSGTAGHVFVRTRVVDKNCVEVSVSDDGHGVPRGSLATIFEDGVTTRYGAGRGYGMGVIKQLSENNMATVAIESPVSNSAVRPGTSVMITFPRVKCLSKEERLDNRDVPAARGNR